MKKSALNFSPQELQVIKNYLAGGVALGGGVGALMGVGNMAVDLKRQADDEVKEDDDTLFLTLPAKGASVGATAIGSGIAAGTLSLLAANALVRKLFQASKRKDVQDELDSAQRANLHGLSSLGKVAAADGRSLGVSEYATGGTVAAALLTALASGIISYKTLGKYFPPVARPENPLPKRVKLMQAPTTAAPQEDAAKYAAANELMVRMALTNHKVASSSLGDLTAAVAQGRGDEMTQMLTDFGHDAMFAACSGASGIPVTKRAADLAITALVKSAALSPVACSLAAAEIFETFPALTATAWATPESEKQALWNFGVAVGENFQAKTIGTVKEASAEAKPQDLEKIIRRAILEENNYAAPQDLKRMKEHMATGEVLSGTSGESANSTDAQDSRDPANKNSGRELPELVMGV